MTLIKFHRPKTIFSFFSISSIFEGINPLERRRIDIHPELVVSNDTSAHLPRKPVFPRVSRRLNVSTFVRETIYLDVSLKVGRCTRFNIADRGFE